MLILKLYFLHMCSYSLLCLKFAFVYNAAHIAQEMDQRLFCFKSEAHMKSGLLY